jgi:hypothetical protein
VRWPTPVATLQSTQNSTTGAATLEGSASRWATPVASDNANRTTREAPSHGDSHGRVLAGQAASWSADPFMSGLHDPTTSTDGESTSPPEDPSPPSSRRRVLNPRFVEALMGLPPGWISVLPTLPSPRWRFSTSDDPINSASPETESSHNKPHSPSSISDEEHWEDDDDVDAA